MKETFFLGLFFGFLAAICFETVGHFQWNLSSPVGASVMMTIEEDEEPAQEVSSGALRWATRGTLSKSDSGLAYTSPRADFDS